MVDGATPGDVSLLQGPGQEVHTALLLPRRVFEIAARARAFRFLYLCKELVMRLPADYDRQTLILDVEALSEMSPDFLRFLVRLRNHADDAHYQIHLVGVSVKLKRTLEKTGLVHLFTYEPE